MLGSIRTKPARQRTKGAIKNKMTKTITKKQKSSAASQLGRLGGRAFVKKHGKKAMGALGKKGMASRWGGKKKTDGGKR